MSHKICELECHMMISWDMRLQIWFLFGDQRNMENQHLKVVSSSDLEPPWFLFFRRSCAAGEKLTRACSFKGRDLEHEVAEVAELIKQPSVFAGNNAFRNCIQDGELKQVKGRELVDGAKLNAQNQGKDGVVSVQVTADNHRASCSGYEIIVISDDEG